MQNSTYPLYCATSSPKTNTFGFDSNSSAKASFNASLTVYSLTPLSFAYPLLCTIAGTRGKDWKALLATGRAAADDTSREAGRKSRDILRCGRSLGRGDKGEELGLWRMIYQAVRKLSTVGTPKKIKLHPQNNPGR